MADEVYKILQSRLRKQAQQDDSASAIIDKFDCDGCRQAKCHQLDDPHANGSNRRKRPSLAEDPLSHKIIEKRRRDRMNSCLADLSHLIPSNYLKKSRGRIEKTEIVEMAIKHIKHLHELLPSSSSRNDSEGSKNGPSQIEHNNSEMKPGSNWQCPQEVDSFRNGYNDCLAESVHFLVEKEHIPPENPLCSRLVNHLNKYLEQKGHAGQLPSTQHHSASTPISEPWGDSDYFSLKSESSVTNSEVSSVVSNPNLHIPGNAIVLNPQKIFQPRLFPMTSPPSPSDTSVSAVSGTLTAPTDIKRKSSEEVTSGTFKFKDSIRERFSHEFESHTENEASGGASKEQEEVDYYSLLDKAPHAAKRRKSCQVHHIEDPKYHSHHHQASSTKHQTDLQTDSEKKKSVPIFALHPKGSHYIPLSVNEEIIFPYLHLFDQGSDLPLMLHPITISVNFCGPIRIASSIRTSHKTSQNEGPLNIKEDRE